MIKEIPLFTVDDLKSAKLDERERIIDLIVKEQGSRRWSIQTPDAVMTYLVDLIRKG